MGFQKTLGLYQRMIEGLSRGQQRSSTFLSEQANLEGGKVSLQFMQQVKDGSTAKGNN